MTEAVSMSALGLRAREGLSCPEGGLHEVPTAAVEAAASSGRPTPAACLKCREVVTLESTH